MGMVLSFLAQANLRRYKTKLKKTICVQIFKKVYVVKNCIKTSSNIKIASQTMDSYRKKTQITINK